MIVGPSLHIVIIETGSIQAFIFNTNKQILNVGASDLVRRLGEEWVTEALREISVDARPPLVAASGKTVLLLEGGIARQVISLVTSRALREAPGLTVWGTIGEMPVEEDLSDVADRLDDAYREHAALRSHIPSPMLRHPLLPFLQPDSYTGAPASLLERANGGPIDGTAPAQGKTRSYAVDIQWKAGKEGRDRLQKKLRSAISELDSTTDNGGAIVSEASLVNGDGVRNNGWVGIVHADGNGIGRLFFELKDTSAGADFLQKQWELSMALDAVTWKAFASAVVDVQETHPGESEWLLPIVVGGDDVTVVVNGKLVYDFTVSFLRHFEEEALESEGIQNALGGASSDTPGSAARNRLTASAGIAVVSPHHPFSHAYELAEELCKNAKQTKTWLRRGIGDNKDEMVAMPARSALDAHVLFESSLRSLEQVRDSLVVHHDVQDRKKVLHLWAGPITLPADDGALVDVHRYQLLAEFMDAIRPPGTDRKSVLPWGAAHVLRTAMLEGGVSLERAKMQILKAVDALNDPDRHRVLESLFDTHLVVDPGAVGPVGANEFSRLLTALDLVDLEQGTAAGRKGSS